MAGKTPAIVDIDALALQNCYEYNYEPAPTQVVALLNLGASVMNTNFRRRARAELVFRLERLSRFRGAEAWP